ncbi:MAG: VWA domain-containing protein [bacterium]|nr:VWA domain-containing protein [bacterium]
MNLSHLWMLNLLWLLPLAAVALIVQNRKKKRAMQGFADPHLLDRLTALEHRGRRFIKGLLLLLSLGLLLFALAGPRWGSHYEEVSQKGVDVMLLIDVSPSMLVEDISPNRLERARREILDFIKVVQGDRVGLVAFAGAAFVQCPLTLDYAALEMFLSALQPDLIPVPGTDLGAAIETGISAYDDKSATDKVIMLITDGEDNEKQGIKAARQAAAKGVKIFVFGIGDIGGGPIPELDGSGGFKKDPQGKLILSKLEEESLREIASLTGGTYVRSVAGDLDLDLLYFDGIKSRTQAKELKSGKIKVYEERFPLFVLAAFMLLLIEGFIDEKIRSKAGADRKTTVPRAVLGFLAVIAISFVATLPSQAAESPDELYRKGRFTEAEKAYARSDMDNPKDLRYRYNRGCAAYQNGDYQSAAAAFASVLRRSQDDDIRFKAAYNLGNAHYQQDDFKSAVDHYKQAIGYDPSNEDTRHNLELALRALQKQKEQQSQDQSQPGEQQQSDGEKKEADKEGQSDENASKQESQKANQSEQSESSQDQKAEQPPEQNAADARQTEQKSQQDLAGDLKPREDMPPAKAQEQSTQTNMTMMNQNKAEALLDNIQEDRSRMMQLQTKGRRQGVASGKDW